MLTQLAILVLSASCVAVALQHLNFRQNIVKYSASSQLGGFSVNADDVQIDIDKIDSTDYELKERARKWFLLNHKKRPEVFLSSENRSGGGLYSEIWKSVLLSVRVLQKHLEMPNYLSIHVFPNLKEYSVSHLTEVAAAVEACLTESSSIFQPNFERKIEIFEMPATNGNKDMLVISIGTQRASPDVADLDDLENYVPQADDIVDLSSLESFPFPTVFDFISEINRPPDAFTMNELRFKFSVKDFKYDVEKMKKKKNPQEIIDSINCKLTRLQNWRDVLEKESPGIDPDASVGEWAEAVRLKFKSLRASAAFDSRRTLDTQYDKRKTFIRIIDMWSDRLKRNFKYIYQSQREPEDFSAPIMNSQWRNELLNMTRLFSQSLFLDLAGPEFTPGEPTPLFSDRRAVLWRSNYPSEVVLYEMITWMTHVDNIRQFNFGSSCDRVFGSVSHHTYSRGFVTERVIMDTFSALDRWLEKSENSTVKLNSATLFATLGEKGRTDRVGTDSTDHTDDYISFLRKLNTFSRRLSMDKASGVKDVYKLLHNEGKELGEWWTTVVRNADMSDEMEGVAKSRKKDEKWSTIIEETINNNLKRSNEVGGSDGIAAVLAAEESEKDSELWINRYKPTLYCAEEIDSFLSWKNIKSEDFIPSSLDKLVEENENAIDFKSETVHIGFDTNDESQSCLVVMPRFFRADSPLTSSMELSAFLEFCKILAVNCANYRTSDGAVTIDVMPLHPKMINQKGQPDYSRRAPHPSVLFSVKSKEKRE